MHSNFVNSKLGANFITVQVNYKYLTSQLHVVEDKYLLKFGCESNFTMRRC